MTILERTENIVAHRVRAKLLGTAGRVLTCQALPDGPAPITVKCTTYRVPMTDENDHGPR